MVPKVPRALLSAELQLCLATMQRNHPHGPLNTLPSSSNLEGSRPLVNSHNKMLDTRVA